MRLLPRDERFFDLFTSVATLTVEAAKHLRELLTSDVDHRSFLIESIKRLEHEADALTHEIITRLDRSFITPLDREDIHLLASRLDDIMDRIDGTARRVQIYRTGPAPHGVIVIADVIVRSTQQVLEAVRVLSGEKAPVVIAACTQIKKLEEEGDFAYHEWLAKLFEEERDPITLIKWKEIYDTLEKTLDQADDVANVLESIAIKHS